MKTLAIDCRMAQMSGIGVYLRNLVPLCMAAMPDVHFRLLGYDDAFDIPPSCTWDAVPFAAPIYSIAEQREILPKLRGCQALWTPHYPVPVLAHVPLIVTVHDVAHLALRDLYGGAKRLYATTMFQVTRHKAAELIFVSEFTRQEFLRYVGKPRGTATVVHNGVDAHWRKTVLQDRREPPYFLAVGNIKPHKNIHFLCEAFAGISENCGANLVFIGSHDGFRVGEISTEKLMNICPGRIQFTGHISQDKLVSLMGKAAALVFPSRYEGFGLPLLEALAAGVPVIASDIHVSREVCDHFAEYVLLDNKEQLGKKLREVLTLSSEDRRIRGEQGRNWASRFTWEKAAEATVPLLRRGLQR